MPVIPIKRTGRPNRITRDIKKGLIELAVRHGSDGKGEGGLGGYFDYLLRKDLAAHARLIGRWLPRQLNVDVEISGRIGITTVQIVSVPNGRFVTQAETERQLTEPVLVIDNAKSIEQVVEVDAVASDTDDAAAKVVL